MRKILIVDDSAFMRGILKDLLTTKSEHSCIKEKIEVFEADGKMNALKKIKEIKPDVILLDIVMQESETEGIEFVEEIKSFYNIKKIIMISSVAQTAILEECQKIGLKCYLQKPFEHEKVIEEINKILE